MSLWKLDRKRFNEQLEVDLDKMIIKWKPHGLKDNIFELLGIAKQIYDVKLIDAPYKVDGETWAIKIKER